MSDDLPLGTQPNGWHSALRTIALYVIIGVLGWVAVTLNQLAAASSVQNGSIIRLQTQVETLQAINSGMGATLPTLTTDMATLKVRVDDNARRINEINQTRHLR